MSALAPEAANLGLSARKLEQMRQWLAGEVEAARLPGAVVALWRFGQPAYSCALGWLDAARGVPMVADSLFRIYSMTKPITSVAALMLLEAGRLNLSDEVVAWLPAFGHRGVTVLDLLMHTAGLPYGPRHADPALRQAYAQQGIGVNPRGLTADALVQGLSQVPLSNPPGLCWEYGNATDLLGVLIEVASGQRLGAFLQDRVFGPLQMHDTAFAVPPGQGHRVAQPFARDPEDGTPLYQPDQSFDPLQAPLLDSGGAGLISTAADYGRFANALLAGGAPLLQPSTLEAMVRDHLAPRQVLAQPTPGEAALQSPGYGFGHGVAVRLLGSDASLPHSPGTFVWSGTAGTLFWVDPVLQLVAVYMTQAPGASRQRYRRLISQWVYRAVDG